MRKIHVALYAIAALGLSFGSASAAMAGPEQAGTDIAVGQASAGSCALVPVRGGHGAGGGHGRIGGGFSGGAGLSGGHSFAAGPGFGRSFSGAGPVFRPVPGAVYPGRGQWSSGWARGPRGHHRRIRRFGPGFVGWGYDSWNDYGGGSCYWNCRAAGHGPAYCRAYAWNFCE